MTGIIVVLPKLEEARGVRNLLVRNGFSVLNFCTSGAQALSLLDDLGKGIILSGYRLTDMMYTELQECLPEGVEMILMASEKHLAECDTRNVVSLSLPLKLGDLLSTVEMVVRASERRQRKLREMPKSRKPEEMELIQKAKELLQERNHLSEQEAHKYLQKCSMDSGANLVETAQKLLAMMS